MKKHKLRILIIFIIIILVVTAMLLVYVYFSNSTNRARSLIYRDGGRYLDLHRTRLALELFHDKNNAYPIVGQGCQDISALKNFLAPTFIPNIPIERYAGIPNYQYASSGDGSEFVLKAILEKKD